MLNKKMLTGVGLVAAGTAMFLAPELVMAAVADEKLSTQLASIGKEMDLIKKFIIYVFAFIGLISIAWGIFKIFTRQQGEQIGQAIILPIVAGAMLMSLPLWVSSATSSVSSGKSSSIVNSAENSAKAW